MTVRSAVRGPVRSAVYSPVGDKFGGVPLAPVVANQTMDFGALTLADAGGDIPTNTGGAITSASIDSGDASGHWQIDPDGTITPTSTGDTADLNLGPYALVCTFTNATGSVTPTITITPEANVYTFSVEAELDAIYDLGAATVSGKTMKGRGGFYDWIEATWKDRVWTSLVTITSHDNNNRVTFDINQKLYRGPGHVYFYQVNFEGNFIPGVNSSAGGALVLLGNFVGPFTCEDCDLKGNLLELYQANGWQADVTYRGLFGTDGNSNLNGQLFTIKNCTLHGSWRMLQIATGGPYEIYNNHFYDFAVDGIIPVGGGTHERRIAWNRFSDPLADPLDVSHGDFIQLIPGEDLTNMKVIGNQLTIDRRDSIPTKYHYQGIFSEDIGGANNYRNYICAGNVIHNSVAHGISLYNQIGARVCNNTSVYDPELAEGFSAYPRIRIFSHESGAVSDNIIKGNTAYAISSVEGTDLVSNNVTSDPETTGQADSYDALFDGPTFTGFSNNAEVLTAFANKASGALDTASPKVGAIESGYVDFVNRVLDSPYINTGTTADLTDPVDVAISTLTTSNGVQVTSIVDIDGNAATNGVVVAVSGGSSPEVRITSDSGGSVVVTDWTTADVVMAEDHYRWVRDTSSASNSTATDIIVDTGGYRETWTITTVAAAGVFSAVTFDGTNDYLTRAAAVTGMADGKTFTFAARFDPGGDATFRDIFRAGNFYIQLRSNNFVRVEAQSTVPALILRGEAGTITSAGGMVTLFCAVDMAKSTMQIYFDDVDKTPATPTISDVIMDLTHTNWGCMATNAGGSKFPADVEFLWLDTAYVDISVQANRDKWLAANIGASGQGPTASTPLIYMTGNAAAWNDAGGINLGSGGAFIMTGAVVDV